MSIEPVKLDDLTWNEMVIATRRRIPAASAGQWTLHAPVDPGITLLDLFAYLLEQRVYWMDHAPDSLIRGALSLIGEKPLPTQVAATVMHFPKVEDFLVLPRAARFTLAGSTPPLIFTADNRSLLLPFAQKREPVGLKIDGEDRTADLGHGKVLCLFPADGKAAEVKIVLYLSRRLPPNVGPRRFSLLVELFESSNVVPQWSPKAPSPPPAAAKVKWFYSGEDGKQVPFAEGEVKDGTAGLRRSGLVTLPVKADWAVDPEEKEPHAYSLWMGVEKATFSAPPRVKRLLPNVVIARHQRKSIKHRLNREWLPLPGNEIVIADLPENEIIKDYPPIEGSIGLKIRERDGKWHRWERTTDLEFHGPADRVFVADRTLGKISFGNGLTGRLPVLLRANEQIRIHYLVGGGAAGKLGTNRSWNTSLTLLDRTLLADKIDAVNVVETIGGEEPETIPAFRERAAAALKARTRAVIREDFEEIARTVPGVAIKRAHAAVGFHPNHPGTPIPGAVTVFILPDVSRDVLDESFDESIAESAFVAAPVPDEGALAMVRQKLDETRLVGTEVFVLSPFYRSVKLTLAVESNAANRIELSHRIKLRLRRFFDPLIGGDDREGWSFGEPVRPSAILREAQAELGDDGTLVNVFIDLPDARLDQADTPVSAAADCNQLLSPGDGPVAAAPACEDVEIGAHHLVKLEKIHVRFERASENQGGLR
ncbi:MAG TPA: baseplate J/gp47 family protein [Pyrinomonadaceae bacterium]|nr:baseplate J/gp47 family protein [Pyrinomonadaceae bacterium]